MHAGKPWRCQSVSHESSQDQKPSTSRKSYKREGKGSPFNKTTTTPSSEPEPGEMKKIAAEGILTCLQDAIDSLKQGQDIRQITEQWACVPRAVEELAKFGSSSVGSAKPHNDLCRQAVTCKQIYELEYRKREDNELLKRKEQSTRVSRKAGDVAAYDSDDTIEMTEEEIDQAYNAAASTIIKR